MRAARLLLSLLLLAIMGARGHRRLFPSSVLYPRIGSDLVSQADHRLAQARASLDTFPTVGYWPADTSIQGPGFDFVAAQYALAPIALAHPPNSLTADSLDAYSHCCSVFVWEQLGSEPGETPLVPARFRVVRDLGRGVLILALARP